MIKDPSSVGREVRRFYETTALAVTFLTFSVVSISIVNWGDLITPLNILSLLVAVVTFIFFAVFSVGLLWTRVTHFYDSIFTNLRARKSWIFVSILWPVIVAGFIAALFLSEAVRLPQFLKGPAVWLAVVWLLYVIVALLIRRGLLGRVTRCPIDSAQTSTAGGDPMANAVPNNIDDYVERVIGEKSRKDLIPIPIRDKNGNIDEKAVAVANAHMTEEADRLSVMVTEQSSSAALTKTCRKLIDEAREIISATDCKANDALGKLDDVKHYLIRTHESRKLRPKLFWPIFGVNFVYVATFTAIVILKSLLPLSSAPPAGMGAGILSCAIWGGVGGVIDALIALNSHFTNQDFDKQYEYWYYVHPIIGMSLGVIVYLLLQAGLATIGNSNAATADGTSTVQVGITAFSIAVAFLAGFKQNAAIEFLSRVVKSVFQKEDSEDKKPS